MPFPYRRERVDRDVHALLADEPGDGDEHGHVGWSSGPPGGPHGSGGASSP